MAWVRTPAGHPILALLPRANITATNERAICTRSSSHTKGTVWACYHYCTRDCLPPSPKLLSGVWQARPIGTNDNQVSRIVQPSSSPSMRVCTCPAAFRTWTSCCHAHPKAWLAPVTQSFSRSQQKLPPTLRVFVKYSYSVSRYWQRLIAEAAHRIILPWVWFRR